MIDQNKWLKFAEDAEILLKDNQDSVNEAMLKHLPEVDNEEDKKYLTETNKKIQDAMKKQDFKTLNALMTELKNKIKK
jgi:N-acetylmuramic acid 6-phosphate (MurNAc-6-P) etherase